MNGLDELGGIASLEARVNVLASSLEAVCAYVDQQLAPLKEAHGKRIATAGQQQMRMECLKLAIGVACMPNAKVTPRGDDVARMARVFENFMKGKMPATAEIVAIHGRP